MYGTSICNHLYVLATLLTYANPSGAFVDINKYYGTVSSGNYTHIKLSISGDLRLSLHTIEGDADLYIKGNNVKKDNVKADYENYDLNAATCGHDYIDVSASMVRPLSVAVYGHPVFANSTYELTISAHTLSNEYHDAPTETTYKEEESESIILMILKFILQFMFEVLF